MKSLQFRSVNKLHGVFKWNSWLKTLLHQNVNMATILTATKRHSYTVSEKLRIVNFAEQNGNRAAEHEFGVSESNVQLWRKSKENLEKMPRLKRANRGKTAAWPKLEVVWRWFSLRAKRGQCGRTWWFCDQWTFRIRPRVGVRKLCCLNLRVFLLTLNTTHFVLLHIEL